MITKLRPRYYCEHCKKSGASKYHMMRHERGCTANINRICGMCALDDEFATPTRKELEDAFAKDVAENWTPDGFEVPIVDPVNLRLVANGCPACMISVIRKTETSTSFDYAKQKDAFWNRVNENRERYGLCH